MIRSFPDLRHALDALPPPDRAGWLARHLAAQPDGERRYAWHLAQGLTHGEPDLLRAVATHLLDHPPSRPQAILALYRLLNRLEDFPALRALIAATPDDTPEPRAEWLRALLRVDLLSPSPEGAAAWGRALRAQPPVALRTLRLLRRLRDGTPADPRNLLDLVARRMARIAARGLPPPLAALAGAESVALVGNGSGLKGSGAGAAIEAHAAVVRINYPRLAGHEADTGRRTDLMLFHGNKRPILDSLMAREPEFPALPAFGLRGNPVPGRQTPPPMPEELVALAAELAYPTPTTGLFAILLIGALFRRPVTLFGFDFFAPGRPGHYFGDTVASEQHEIAFERWFAARALPILSPALRRDPATC
jgi:hypothetical protein